MRARNWRAYPAFVPAHYLLKIKFVCNNDRLDDETTKQLKDSLRDGKTAAILTILLRRFAASPGNGGKPEKLGPKVIAHMVTSSQERSDVSEYIKTMRFSRRHTYRSVLNKDELTIVMPEVADDVASLSP